jgi:hypothetical protein
VISFLLSEEANVRDFR